MNHASVRGLVAAPEVSFRVPEKASLIAVDMDGTLLDGAGEVPTSFWPVLDALSDKGVRLVVASGRQYASLKELFGERAGRLIMIAENGAHVVADGEEVSVAPLDSQPSGRLVTAVRELARERDLGLIWSGRWSAYAERTDERFLAEAQRYYRKLRIVDDLLACPEEALKFAVLDLDGATGAVSQTLMEVSEPYQVVVASMNWTDIMDPRVNKGVGLRAIQDELGVDRTQTMVFGDYLNDLELMDAADYSYAMANAHPEVIRRARFVAPPNTEEGVVTVLTALLHGLQAN